jgi:hypothetical protein
MLVPGLAVLGATFSSWGCQSNCLALCRAGLRIALDQTVVRSDRFTVQVNGQTQALGYLGAEPPAGVDEYRANQIQVEGFAKTDQVVVRWLVEGTPWFDQAVATTWSEHSICGSSCYWGEATLHLPPTLPDGTPTGSFPAPCAAEGCTNRVVLHLDQPVAWQADMIVAVDGWGCPLSGCAVDRSVSPCVATSLATAGARDCADLPTAVDAIVVRTQAVAPTLEWRFGYDLWFAVTVSPSYGPAIYPAGQSCDPPCHQAEVSIAIPSSPPAVLDASAPADRG